MSEIDYDKLADAVAKRLSLLPPPEKIIWDAKRCAEYLGVTEKHFVDKKMGDSVKVPCNVYGENFAQLKIGKAK